MFLVIYTNFVHQAVYERVARGMLHTDRLTFALLLCRIHLKGTGAEDILDQQFAVFLRGKEGFVSHTTPHEALTSQQHQAAARLSSRFSDHVFFSMIIIILLNIFVTDVHTFKYRHATQWA